MNNIIDEIRNIKSGRKELRDFGLVMAAACAVIGGLLLWKGRPAAPYALGAGAGFAILGLALPAALRPLQRAWMALAVVLGFVMTRVVLSALFFLVITPIGMIARVLGKRFLTTGPDPSMKTYWQYRDPGERSPEEYERQF